MSISLLCALAVLDAPAITMQREGSGTSWMPDSTPMYALHGSAAGFMLMLHGSISLGYDDQWSARGSRAFVSTNWLMGMAQHELLGGSIEARAMLSAEPATAAGVRQVPLLLQTGETYGGAPLRDKQHPHDLFMELALLHRQPIAGGVALELYGALAGEPALGPPAFMHRASALVDPLPPIGHHWQDSTHISYGVVTAGLFTSFAKLEASVFNGREPDENRWNFDFGPLDSWSARLSVNPIRELSMQVSYGYLKSPEALAPAEDVKRATASVQWNAAPLALTAVWGANFEDRTQHSALLEALLDLGAHAPFARVEYVQKTGADLVLADRPQNLYDLWQLSLGYVHRLPAIGPVVPALGARVDLATIPPALSSDYATRNPVGAFVFLQLQPQRMSEEDHSMHHHHHHQME